MKPAYQLSVLVAAFVICGAFVHSANADEIRPEKIDGAASDAGRVDYLNDVRPILRAKCAMCHNEAEPSGGLRLDLASQMIKGGDSGPVLVAGNSKDSRLVQAVLHTGDLKMPPPEEGKPLEPSQIAVLQRWIDQGAAFPEDETVVRHWAFLKPERPEIPNIAAAAPSNSELSSSANPVDAFLIHQQQAKNVHALPLASRPVLLRRIYLDVIGLPPTPEQVASFVNDTSPEAWEKVVDELLASPHYGERWGRHWMDVWRYSDWDGYGAEVRESKPHIWRWRDWIIESLNADKPYDQMIVEMLAADEAAPNDAQALRATGFLVRNWYVFNRNTWIDTTIEHTGKAFMGVTFNCARCHDHMYDPFSQSEYYSLRSFFEPHDVRTDRVPGQSDVAKDGLVRVYDANATAQTLLFVRGDEKNPLKDKPHSPKVPAVFGSPELPIQPVELPPSAWYPGLQDFVRAESIQVAEAELATATAAEAAAKNSIAAARDALVKFRDSATGKPEIKTVLSDDFASARPDVWTIGSGNWQYAEGRVTQSDTADNMVSLNMIAPHPVNFHAKLRFRPTGGDTYKSVGLSFDASDDKNMTFVYASAGGSKVQVAHRINGADQYPGDAGKITPVELNKEHELQVIVRGQVVEVLLNGQSQLTYTLPGTRPPEGRIRIWTYDATAEFLAFELTDASEVSEASLLAAEQKALLSLPLAEKNLAVAMASMHFAKARIAADDANYAQPPAANAKELSLLAGKAEKDLALLQEEVKLLKAENALAVARSAVPAAEAATAKAVTDAEAAVSAAQKTVETAKKAASEPFEAYTRLTPLYPSGSTGRRLAFAKWIASHDNPLTARVAVNHIWLRHFHQPLVPTVFDFGMNGKTASHPELLDWLACELMENGWKMKSLHRLILTSQAYQRMSSPTANEISIAAENAATDPENRLLWRQNSYRMEAEIVRDSTFHIAGQLDTKMYGPDLDPNSGLTVARRSVYFRTSKEKKMTFLSTFDSANPVECYQRAESISPQQSLAMSNSPLTLAQSRVLATRLSERLAAEPATNTADRFVSLAFQHVLNREPKEEELQECVQFLQKQSERYASGVALTAFAGNGDNAVKPSADATGRARENLVHVLMNHNDFVTVR